MLYKFRSPANPEFTTDILKNNRLFCADFRELNDPMEGTYDTLVSGPHATHRAQVEEIYNGKIRSRVCSLSRTYKHHAMWAYYAGDYSGLAIEIDLPDGAATPIDYASGSRIQKWGDGDNAYQIAQRILTTKHAHWAHEQEVRILYDGNHYKLPQNSIRRVIIGSRASKDFLQEVSAVCAKRDIAVTKLGVRNGQLHAR